MIRALGEKSLSSCIYQICLFLLTFHLLTLDKFVPKYETTVLQHQLRLFKSANNSQSSFLKVTAEHFPFDKGFTCLEFGKISYPLFELMVDPSIDSVPFVLTFKRANCCQVLAKIIASTANHFIREWIFVCQTDICQTLNRLNLVNVQVLKRCKIVMHHHSGKYENRRNMRWIEDTSSFSCNVYSYLCNNFKICSIRLQAHPWK